MIENSTYLSGADFFRADIASLIERLHSDRLMPDFTGATATIFGIGRGGSADRLALPQDRLTKLQDFWTAYFEAAGAKARLSQNLSAAD